MDGAMVAASARLATLLLDGNSLPLELLHKDVGWLDVARKPP